MPFELGQPPRKRIAVVGGGISGLGAAYFLSGDYDVVLFEAEPRLGGHARTVLAGRNGHQPVDTGFIVFNYANYPHLTRLFEELDVPVAKSDMSFGASIRGGWLEFGLKDFGSVFAQRRNIVRPQYYGMIRDILRFNARALDVARDPGMTIRDFLAVLGTGDWFRDYYLTPLSGAIWSTPTQGILDFPAKAMVEFFRNHALLDTSGQHQWYTVQGGSREYVDRLGHRLYARGVDVRLSAPVAGVRRQAGSAEVRATGGDWEGFDDVVFATHADDTLRLISDPSPDEATALGLVSYQPNDMVLHADERMMPRRRKAWASWVYTEDADKRSDRIDLTYWMNSLQPIPHSDPMFVTLNSTRTIREDLIYDQATFRHPVYTLDTLAGQDLVRTMNGTNRTWFCGAWMRNGFHEDGLSSAVDVVEAMRRSGATTMAAE
ncbi:NAD(P)/FAD-dependent oxidoreductase [Anianabacter salinae]|uniref:NAD(P)/FAD-dependent oxidoreductase n=1 Tax=Anianabacter salinae TaxID=2851023 RepID=UPI00225E06A2|nr:FAD-dependent oxidoreductase [Anianabacter salinae]MBV0913334.1 FAD-dependent oxidoreductase [Anianabacter salinae]